MRIDRFRLTVWLFYNEFKYSPRRFFCLPAASPGEYHSNESCCVHLNVLVKPWTTIISNDIWNVLLGLENSRGTGPTLELQSTLEVYRSALHSPAHQTHMSTRVTVKIVILLVHVELAKATMKTTAHSLWGVTKLSRLVWPVAFFRSGPSLSATPLNTHQKSYKNFKTIYSLGK